MGGARVVTPTLAAQCQRILDQGGTFRDVLVYFDLTVRSRWEGTRCPGCGDTTCACKDKTR